MNRRCRAIIALLSLITFSVYLAGDVFAAGCETDMDMAGMLMPAPDGAHAGMAGMADMPGMVMPDMHAERSVPADDEPAPDCPLALHGCFSASLPSLRTVVAAAPFGTTLESAAAQTLHDTLFSANLFHPPRA